MSNIVPFNYNGQPVRFNADGWINATEAARHFGKRVKDWLRQDSTQEYIAEVEAELSEGKGEESPLLVKVVRGRRGGTWLHPELAVEFARWLSPKFARWCDRQIKGLIRHGMVAQGHEHLMALLVRPEASEWQRRFPPEYYQALARVTNTRYLGHAAGTPSLWGRITRRWVYGAIMPREVLAELDARRHDGDKLHQWLTDGGADALDRQIAAITLLANTASDFGDFEARCHQLYGTGQLRLIYPSAA